MEQKKLARWLKVIILGMGICGLLVYLGWIPATGQELVRENPEYGWCYLPWLVFLWVTALPCYGVLGLAWKVAGSIQEDHAFTLANARRLRWVSRLAAGDTVFFLLGNVVFLLLGMNHPGILVVSLMIVFLGLAIAVVSGGLSYLVGRAAALQDQSDWTI